MRCLWLLLIVFLSACAPALPPQQLSADCQGTFSSEQLRSGQWLQADGTWRLRQGALLEIGMKKIPLEGFLRLDLQRRTARLVALNEIGLVLFDLQISPQGDQLVRAIPQLKERANFATGIALSLRRMFLQPDITANATVESAANLQLLTLKNGGKVTLFSFDCQGDQRQLREISEKQGWRVQYNDYADFSGFRLPEEIIYYDRSHAVKLTLWLREARQEP